MPKSTNKATRDLKEDFPAGTLVRFFDDGKSRLGTVKTARGGLLHIVSPPMPKRCRHGLTRELIEAVQETFRLPREKVAAVQDAA